MKVHALKGKQNMIRLVVVALILLAYFCFIACDQGGESEDNRATTEEQDDDLFNPDSSSDDDDDDYESCTISFLCKSGSCGDLACWEPGTVNNCEGACYAISTPEGNDKGLCVDKCEEDNDCPAGFFCLPACPEIEGYFEVRWCVQNEHSELRECPGI